MIENCGVVGDYTMSALGGLLGLTPRIPFVACPSEATETVQFRCVEGHERSRTVCAAHADVLQRPKPDERAYCLVCYEETGREVVLTPIGAAPERPVAEVPWWRKQATGADQ